MAASFAAFTLVGYLGSVVFHLVPWATRRAYTLALCFDYVTISVAFSGQMTSVVGLRSVSGLLSTGITLGIALLCAAGLHSGAVMWEYRRVYGGATECLLPVAA